MSQGDNKMIVLFVQQQPEQSYNREERPPSTAMSNNSRPPGISEKSFQQAKAAN